MRFLNVLKSKHSLKETSRVNINRRKAIHCIIVLQIETSFRFQGISYKGRYVDCVLYTHSYLWKGWNLLSRLFIRHGYMSNRPVSCCLRKTYHIQSSNTIPQVSAQHDTEAYRRLLRECQV